LLISLTTVATTAWKHFYSLEAVAGYNPIAEYWLPLGFQDGAYLHTLIGCAYAYVSGYKAIIAGKTGLKHLQSAISIINKRLTAGGDDICSTGTLTVIAAVALLEVWTITNITSTPTSL
jgi:hypothetical protein